MEALTAPVESQQSKGESARNIWRTCVKENTLVLRSRWRVRPLLPVRPNHWEEQSLHGHCWSNQAEEGVKKTNLNQSTVASSPQEANWSPSSSALCATYGIMDLGSQDLDRLQSSVANELISLPTSSQRDGPESASTETHGPAQ